MRNLLAIIFLMFFASLAVDLSGVGSRVGVEWQLFQPNLAVPEDRLSKSEITILASPQVTLRGDAAQSLVGYIRSYGMLSTSRLVVEFSGGPMHLVTTSGVEEVLTGSSAHCTTQPEEGVVCKLLLRISDAEDASLIIAPYEGDLSVKAITLETAQVKRATLLSGNLIYAIFIGLILIGPLLVFSRRLPRLEGFSLVAISISWMAFLSVEALLLVVFFLACVYFSLKWMIFQKKRSRTLLVAYFLLLISFLLFIKLALPFLGYVFANPGAMWFALPLGFSYFIIKIVDVLVAVHSKALQELKASEFFVFMLFPATLAAGPIFTLDQFRLARIKGYTIIDWAAGLGRFILGALKKLSADAFVYTFIVTSTSQFILEPESLSTLDVCSFLLLTTLYVYLDFSAYSDMAIGAGRSLGWKVPENFDLPLLRLNMHAFWRSWHMTLSNWVFRRVFVTAIMGSRSRLLSTLVSMLTIGLWHQIGLAWTFWALHHSIMLVWQERVTSVLLRVLGSLKSTVLHGFARFLSGLFGLFVVWCWVSLGHSFTQFSDLMLSFTAYYQGLQGAGVVVSGFVMAIALLWVLDKSKAWLQAKFL